MSAAAPGEFTRADWLRLPNWVQPVMTAAQVRAEVEYRFQERLGLLLEDEPLDRWTWLYELWARHEAAEAAERIGKYWV